MCYGDGRFGLVVLSMFLGMVGLWLFGCVWVVFCCDGGGRF